MIRTYTPLPTAVCCIYHKPRAFGESSSESDSGSDSDSDCGCGHGSGAENKAGDDGEGRAGAEASGAGAHYTVSPPLHTTPADTHVGHMGHMS